MHLDDLTLLWVSIMLSGMFCILWLLNFFIFKVSSLASLHYAGANMCIATCIGLYFLRDLYHIHVDYVGYVGSDVFLYLGIFLFHRGIQEFIKVKKQDKIQLLFLSLIICLDIYIRYNNLHLVGTIMIGISCSYNIFKCAKDGFIFLKKEFETKTAIITTLPLYLMSLFFFIKAFLVIFNHTQNLALSYTNDLTIGFLMVIVIGILGFNGSALGLLISRMIYNIKILSVEDVLTKTFNRRHMGYLAQNAINKTKKSGKEVSIIMLDLDHFKNVNDTFGHAAGDKALIVCAETLKQFVREKDYVGRLGGEEFCIVLPETGIKEASKLAERIREKLQIAIVEWEGKKITITASFGVASLKPKNEWSDLLNQADLAMYQAKNNGRNQVVTI